MKPEDVDRYLHLLGLPRREPSMDALCQLVAAQLGRVPFENISKLYYRDKLNQRKLPGPKQYLDGMERYYFGGTCYATNYYLNQLLAALGYRVRLCGADMKEPDVHLVSIVVMDEREFLLDVGYAAPFLAPLPRDMDEDVEIELGTTRYVLEPQDGEGCSRLLLYRDGKPIHGYRVNPRARQIEEFSDIIADSFLDTSTFMNAILLTRFEPDFAYVIHNLSVIVSRGRQTTVRKLADHDELAQVIRDGFGIPVNITMDVLRNMPTMEDAWA